MRKATSLAMLIAIALVFTEEASAFAPRDNTALVSLSSRIITAQRDDLDAAHSLIGTGAFDSAQCLMDIGEYLGEFGDTSSFILTLTDIANEIKNPFDIGVVERYLAIQARNGLGMLPIARRAANLSAGHCGWSAVVVSRANVALSLFDEGERLLRSLSR